VTRTGRGRIGAASLLAVAVAVLVAGPAGAKTKTYSSGPLNAPIPDASYPLEGAGGVGTHSDTTKVKANGKIRDVNVSVRLTHPYDEDLEMWLVSPRGAIVKLVLRRGADGDNFGEGAPDCTGTFTVLDDQAATPIGSATAPLAGSFRPEQPLSRLNGKRAAGPWTLVALDTLQGDAGMLHCWQLTIAFKGRKKQ